MTSMPGYDATTVNLFFMDERDFSPFSPERRYNF